MRTRGKVLTSQYRVVLGLVLESGEVNRDHSLPTSSGGVSSHLRGDMLLIPIYSETIAYNRASPTTQTMVDPTPCRVCARHMSQYA